ncbi:hypothetical protein MASR1M12_15510 [Erysipelotrichia bacterium]
MEPIQNIQGEITDKKAKDKRRGWKNNRDKRKDRFILSKSSITTGKQENAKFIEYLESVIQNQDKLKDKPRKIGKNSSSKVRWTKRLARF